MITCALVAVLLTHSPPAQAPPAPAPGAEAAPQDPTPAQIFARALAAVGPVQSFPCLRAEGSIETPESRSALTIVWDARPPRRIVVRETLADGRVAEWGCDARRGWIRVPGREAPVELEPVAVMAVRAALVPSNMVMALADRFPIRTAVTPETLDGVRCLRVDLEDRDGLPGAAWFDMETGRLRAFRSQASREDTPGLTTIEAWTEVGPLRLPSRLTCRSGDRVTRTTFTSLSVEAIPDAAFAPPLPPPPPSRD